MLTPIVPVQPDGITPGLAPVIYVSATSTIFGPSTKVFKLEQNGAALDVVRDAPFPGEPSPAMAVSQLAQPGMEDGKLLLGVSINHFLLSTRDLDVVGSFDTEFDLEGGKDGYQHTTGAVSGHFVFIADDSGRQYVVRLQRRQAGHQRRPSSSAARPTPAPTTAGSASRQWRAATSSSAAPTACSSTAPRRRPRRARPAPADDAPPTVAFTGPADGARLSGAPTLTADAADDRGVASVRFMAGARVLCTDTTAPYACPFSLTGADVGRATLVAVATDGAGQTATARARASASAASRRARVTARLQAQRPACHHERARAPAEGRHREAGVRERAGQRPAPGRAQDDLDPARGALAARARSARAAASRAAGA